MMASLSKGRANVILAIVLLDLRTCFKEDLGTSVTEIYTLKMPSKFFSSEKMPSDLQIFMKIFA